MDVGCWPRPDFSKMLFKIWGVATFPNIFSIFGGFPATSSFWPTFGKVVSFGGGLCGPGSVPIYQSINQSHRLVMMHGDEFVSRNQDVRRAVQPAGGKSAFAPFIYTLHAPGQLRPRLPDQRCARSLASMAPSRERNLDSISVVLMAAIALYRPRPDDAPAGHQVARTSHGSRSWGRSCP